MTAEIKFRTTRVQQYFEAAPALAQRVLNCWGDSSHAVNLPADFLALLDRACVYHPAARLADPDVHLDVEPSDVKVKLIAQLEFAREYERLVELAARTTEDQ